MSIAQGFLGEWDQEVESTKKLLALVPADKADWKPHPKSMSLGRLASHVAELPSWASATLELDELDMNPPGGPAYTPAEFGSTETNLANFERIAVEARKAIERAPDAEFMRNWTLKTGGNALFTMPKIAVLRSFVFNHLIHHRAQLGVYLRLQDVKIPGMYGPSADYPM
jgi:uncharacterized damage-inducible protein DinB